jgi:hypothetical protein
MSITDTEDLVGSWGVSWKSSDPHRLCGVSHSVPLDRDRRCPRWHEHEPELKGPLRREDVYGLRQDLGLEASARPAQSAIGATGLHDREVATVLGFPDAITDDLMAVSARARWQARELRLTC